MKVKNMKKFEFRRAHCDKYRRVAFTLAEILITLGIIGVVAALTIPSLIVKYQDKVLINQTKKAYSVFQNGLALASQDNGTPGDNSLTFPKDQTSDTVIKNFSKYFNGAQVCINRNQNGCSQYYYETLPDTPKYNNSGEVMSSVASSPVLILSDGAIFEISSNRTGCENTRYTGVNYDYYSAICANVTMDVNGVKGPNQYGRDVYHLWVYKNKIDFNSNGYGGTSLSNILSGKEKLVYTKYQKGQKK